MVDVDNLGEGKGSHLEARIDQRALVLAQTRRGLRHEAVEQPHGRGRESVDAARDVAVVFRGLAAESGDELRGRVDIDIEKIGRASCRERVSFAG